jgi:DNA polymerase-1
MRTLYLLDGMALAYRAHFALIRAPIRTSKGFNTSAAYGFAQVLLELIEKKKPTHLAVAFDTDAPTPRHTLFADYKAQREAMPEELSAALPYVRRIIQCFNVPILQLDGYEADDIIATLACRAEAEGFTTYMVTPDKDFGQLVTDKILIYKPGRQGSDAEVLGVPEVLARWNIQNVDQVVDLLGLMGDASDNIPGVPGVGEKTAAKLILEYGNLEGVLENASKIKGKLGERIREHQAQARLSKELATICRTVPLDVPLDSLAVREPDRPALSQLFVELEFNALGRRILGEDFKAGRGFTPAAPPVPGSGEQQGELMLGASLHTIATVPHEYRIARTPDDLQSLCSALQSTPRFACHVQSTSPDPKEASIAGIAFSTMEKEAWYVPVPEDKVEAQQILTQLRPCLTNPSVEKIGHDLKSEMAVLAWHDILVEGPFFDIMLAHSLVEPGKRHGMEFLAESYLGYTPLCLNDLTTGKEPPHVRTLPEDHRLNCAAEAADLNLQLHARLAPLLSQQGQDKVFHEIECPLLPVLVSMEKWGVAVDRAALEDISASLGKQIAGLETRIVELAGRPFNLNSPRQLGEILFDELKLVEKAKKTKTGQYVTDEQVLLALAPDHEIVRLILEYREANKLKSTYVDALPGYISPRTGRIHTTYSQAMTTTGRMASLNPNLQNIPVRREQGREIRRAFVPEAGWLLLSADYSQIELRIMAALSGDAAMLEAFAAGRDIHTETASRVYGVDANAVSDEMRRSAKTVNFGIIYGISAFGLAQRLGIPRSEGQALIQQYFATFPGIKKQMDDTIQFCRQNGYVETVTGRRRYLPDIRSANATVRAAAERNAINAPIQGTAADMIKIAMARVHQELTRRKLRTRMLLQVHDELVFELWPDEQDEVIDLIKEKMRNALPLGVPVEVEAGVGGNWLEAH